MIFWRKGDEKSDFHPTNEEMGVKKPSKMR